MTDGRGRPPLDWSGNVPFPFTRESAIRIDSDGNFWHEGQKVEHSGLARAMASWISRHPDDGRWVLENGWDWCYVKVDDAPFVVRSARVEGDQVFGVLSDGVEEPLESLSVDESGTLRCLVRPTARGGPIPAKLARLAQLDLADHLEEHHGAPVLRLAQRVVPL